VSSQDVWYVYVLKVTARYNRLDHDNPPTRVTIHVGIAKDDVQRRVGEHQDGRVKATAGKQIELLGHSPGTSHTKALQFEAWLKKQRPDKKRFIADAWNLLR
jgi:predicted GIY-YIG superfamily endonuclease